MKICLITDLHIDLPGECPNGLDTRLQFIRTIQKIKEKNYDLMIVAGDLCHKTGVKEIYDWIKIQLDEMSIPYHVISGNHDSSVLLADSFDLGKKLFDEELYFQQGYLDGNIIFLDTSRGMMSDKQFIWLEEKIEKLSGTVIICMHHPPLLAHCTHMEPKYMFTQMQRFETLCLKCPDKQFQIFCGHYHIERTIIHKNITIFITPSTFIQIDPDSFEFRKAGDYFGYREIFINEGNCNYTNLIYV
jgi:3',5'-cyclic-AMP phosphodiesterase